MAKVTNSLTTSVDTVNFAGSYNAINGTGTTFTAGDSISGNGYGVGNTLNVKDSTGASAAGVPAGVTVGGVQTANVTSTGSIGGSATEAVAQVNTIEILATPASSTDTVVVNYGSLTQSVVLGASATTAAAAVAAGINALAGATIATASTGVVTITAPVAGTALPTIALSNWSDVDDAAGATNEITTANQAAGTDAQYDVSGWTGLTAFNGTSVGGENLKAAATTSISATDSALGAGAITTVGGNNVTIAATAQTTGTITVGSSTATQQPTGAVSITSTAGTNGASVTAGAINVTGGTSVSVAQSVATGVTAGSTVNQSAVNVTGNATTTSVTVNQANTAANQATVNAAAGIPYAAAVTAAPGVTGVVGAAGQAWATAKVASPAVNQGVVTIADKNATSETAAGSISTVTLNGFGNGSAITTNALTTLNVGGTTANGGATLALTDNLSAHQSAGTTLALNTTALIGQGTSPTAPTISDTNGTIEVVNLTNSGVSSFTLSSAEVGTLSITGSGSVTMGVNTTNLAGLTSLSVGGSVSFNDNALAATTTATGSLGAGLASYGSKLALTNTSSGNFTGFLAATTQSYTGGTGNDTIVIAADATKAITGGTGADELVLGAAGSTFTAAYSGRNVSGFETLGVLGTGSNNTIDVAQLFNNTFSTINVRGTTVSTTTTVNNVAQNAAINFANSSAGSVVVNYIDKTGATDNVTVTIGSATNTAAKTVNSLQVQDANGVGIGTLNIVSNNLDQSGAVGAADASGANVITTLISNNLANLNVSGSGDLTVTNGFITSADAVAINNTGTGTQGLTLGYIDGANGAGVLDTVTFTGSNATTVTNLVNTDNVLTLTNSGSSSVTVAELDATVDSLTVNGNITIGGQSNASTPTINYVTLGSTTGITVNASTNNSQVNIQASNGADATYTNTYTLGNGNNNIDDNTVAGDVVVSVGTGQDNLVLGTTSNTTGAFAITLAADAKADSITAFNIGSFLSSGVFSDANYGVVGAGAADIIVFGTVSSAATGSIAQVTAGSTLATTLAALYSSLNTSNEVNYAYFGGNTYIAATTYGGSAVSSTNTTLVELTGIHTFAASQTAGSLVLAS